MVATKIDLKALIKKKLQSMNEPFKTREIVNFAKLKAPNIYASSNRIAKYIAAADVVEFNKNKKVWNKKAHPNIKDKMQKNNG